ncbi:alpha/beta hydrolase family protein [Pseudoduganella namucuonensis]|uniref:Serine aminopeptidase S33 domain-containing protein n=1 Tax=Pseudoduganella namucuonensis TaxID=1035707 RepID=A0A1I7IL78_9BURK|nr:alpha/beta hydrolase [Pseudoduganella namucuonensis]SFU73656.1 hypothetical protein SAMN05216552_1008114 [Pseudoduganella namucuonensis]
MSLIKKEVSFDNPSAAIKLAATLSLPEGKGPFPAVVLISGTGRNTRDEEVDGHQCFLVIADALNRRGIAVLRYDKRGVGGSSGGYLGATTADFASDANAAVNFLKTDARIDARRIGVVGHSEGGIIAPAVAAENKHVAFFVMIASPGIRGDKLFVLQSAMTAQVYGVPADIIARRKLFDQRLYDAIISAPTGEAAREQAEALVARGVADKVIDANDAETLPMSLTSAWQRHFLAYDPAIALRKLNVPVLALNGSLDVQVPATENLAAIRTALRDNKDATVLDDETMAPGALKIITDWVAAHCMRIPRNQAD